MRPPGKITRLSIGKHTAIHKQSSSPSSSKPKYTMTDTGTSASSKRKASAAFVPDSIASYLMGALRDNFDHLKSHIQQDCDFVSNNSNAGAQAKLLLEEMCRYLYLLAESSI